MNHQFRSGLLLILSAATGYAFLPSLVRAIYERSDLQPTDIAVWRFAIATPLIWLALAWRRRGQPVDLGIARWRPLSLGLLYAASVLVAFIGLETIPASIYIVLFYTYPTMVALLSALLGVRLSGWAWLAVGLTLLGVLLTVPNFFGEARSLDAGGIVLALLNAASVALYYLLSERLLRRVRDLTLSAAWLITGCGLTIFALLPFQGLRGPQDTTTWLLLALLASLCTAYPMFALNAAIQRIGSSLASLFSTVEPVLGIVLAALLLAERVTLQQWLGAALIVTAVALLALVSRSQTNPAEL
ncbi:MAG: DMT family transporter [Anaerolineae bacterium]|nr:DMT family transporter [Anaerolineae bacterium]MDW8171861.1 DMT family transporter [Anaerolineae bacterium]